MQMPSVFSRGIMGRGIFRVLGLSELQEAKDTIQGKREIETQETLEEVRGRETIGDTFHMRYK